MQTTTTEDRKHIDLADDQSLKDLLLNPLTILITLSLCYIFTWVNICYPILRFHYPGFNDIAAICAMLTPIILVINNLRFKQNWLRIGGLFLLIPIAIASLLVAAVSGLFMLLDGGFFSSPSFENIKTINLSNSNLIIYRTDGGATTDYGLIIRQEKQIFPGLSVVRELHNQYHCDSVTQYQIGTDGSIELDLNCDSPTKLHLRPKSFIYF